LPISLVIVPGLFLIERQKAKGRYQKANITDKADSSKAGWPAVAAIHFCLLSRIFIFFRAAGAGLSAIPGG
jgi:hypothetical protein